MLLAATESKQALTPRTKPATVVPEKRRQERVCKRAVVHYHSNGEGTLGVIMDVGYGGLRLACRLPREEDPTSYPCLPQTGAKMQVVAMRSSGGTLSNTTTCRIQWCRDDVELGIREMGLKFERSFDQVDSWIESVPWSRSSGTPFMEHANLRHTLNWSGPRNSFERPRLNW